VSTQTLRRWEREGKLVPDERTAGGSRRYDLARLQAEKFRSHVDLGVAALSQRGWTCPACGSIHDRDVNAAINLKNMAASSAVSACGEEGSGQRRKTLGETSLCEAGSQLCSCLGRDEQV